MVREQIEVRGVRDTRVLDAMRRVPREKFVDFDQLQDAYDDRPLPIANGQTISQPYIVARMTELLLLPPRSIVLEVGTGCGYQTAILAELASSICSIERDAQLVQMARRNLSALGYTNVTIRHGDGFHGWPDANAKFHGILVTCAAEAPPPQLLKQLAFGGTMVMPLGKPDSIQHLHVIRRDVNGNLSASDEGGVRFVPMTPGLA